MRPPSGRPPYRRTPAAADWADARTGIDLVKGKWVLAVAAALSNGPRRYSELLLDIGASAGIADKVLTATLRRMQRNGLVTQKLLHADTKANAGYALTPLGRSLTDLAVAVADWTRKHAGQLPAHLRRRPTRRRPR